jgi:alcohol dehydrogenase class IV
MNGFLVPVKIIMGKGCVGEHARFFGSLGKRALLVTGRSSAKRNGSERDVRAALEKQNISCSVYDGVEANPSTRHAREAAERAVKEQADFVIGIGGGSALDAAKVAAILATNDINDEALFANAFSHAPLPIAAVPTTAGTGSEVTQYAILTNPLIQSKSTVSGEALYPKLAFLDAAYTETLSAETTIHTALDALSHSVESYLSNRATEASSAVALEGIGIVGRCLARMHSGKTVDFELREQLLYGSLLGGIAIAQTATTALHAMGYSLTYFKNVDHGRANGLLMAEYLNYIAVHDPEKVATVLGVLCLRDMDALSRMIDDLLGAKESITAGEAAKFAAIAMKARNIPFTLRVPSQEDLEGMLLRSLSRGQ